ncbi:dihydrolipoamide acetyltransferase family protein [Sedimenticola selenatireducens]|uniref:Dihydrolipoamide acetyltransferase component of pyruvate dehydrogenase complex n=1 Tax=Sedimenticola selenatireducens TaxID=191960 RepID=A0A557RUM2_9GAMM|nr:2-oxo acid dehydrogenase subunit E2 [Sedimenticola selenatireducens]TVO68852.1 dihydrolipoamide succinyltransferase [Sedimenticola selenatireducens]TVT61224.1 MAG: dihydrolipoamide succinyltransferase [Sedimenticola selenatireducens]
MVQMVDIIVPEGEQQGTAHVLANWLKMPGESVTINAPLVDIETDKVMVEVAAPASGILKDIFKKPGDNVTPGTLLGRIELTGSGDKTAITDQVEPVSNPIDSDSQTDTPDHALLSPAVRRLVKQHPVDLNRIEGTGKRGRVTKQDILNYLKQTPTSPAETVQRATAIETKGKEETRQSTSSTHIPHDNMRRRIAAHMTESLLHTAPHVTSIFEADLSAITRHRKQNKAHFEQHGTHLTFTAYFVYAAVQALQRVPQINSRFHEESLELFSDMNIGVGTALNDKGLIVPVLHQAQNKNLLGIASELQQLAEKARRGKLSPAEIQGGTFTLSNHGVSGSLVATPIIINQPQSAILGIGKMQKRVIVKEIDGVDTIQIRPMAYITLTIDHRALDAYQTNRFLTRFVEVIEEWK